MTEPSSVTQQIRQRIPPPYLNIARAGDYSAGGHLHSSPALLEASVQVVRERLAAGQTVRLMVFAHGGLNSETNAALTHLYLQEHLYSTILDALAFPIFWQSGLWDVTRSILEGNELYALLRGQPAARRRLDDWAQRNLEQPAQAPRSAPRASAAAQARFVEVLLRLTGLGALGRAFWDTMKFQTKNTFSGNVSTAHPNSEMPGRTLLRGLIALKLEHPRTLQIHLLGHSAGSILLGHMLEATATLRRAARVNSEPFPERVFEQIILMAPAITYVDFENHLWRNQDLYRDLHVFALKEAFENDSLEPLHQIYPSTLLYLVSNVFEEQQGAALLGLERDAGRVNRGNFLETRRYLFGNVARFTFAPSGADVPYPSEATSHGGFPRDAQTLESVRRIVMGESG